MLILILICVYLFVMGVIFRKEKPVLQVLSIAAAFLIALSIMCFKIFKHSYKIYEDADFFPAVTAVIAILALALSGYCLYLALKRNPSIKNDVGQAPDLSGHIMPKKICFSTLAIVFALISLTQFASVLSVFKKEDYRFYKLASDFAIFPYDKTMLYGRYARYIEDELIPNIQSSSEIQDIIKMYEQDEKRLSKFRYIPYYITELYSYAGEYDKMIDTISNSSNRVFPYDTKLTFLTRAYIQKGDAQKSADAAANYYKLALNKANEYNTKYSKDFNIRRYAALLKLGEFELAEEEYENQLEVIKNNAVNKSEEVSAQNLKCLNVLKENYDTYYKDKFSLHGYDTVLRCKNNHRKGIENDDIITSVVCACVNY